MKRMTIVFTKLGEDVLFSNIVEAFIAEAKNNKNIISMHMDCYIPYIALDVKKCVSKETVKYWLSRFQVNANVYYKGSGTCASPLGNMRFSINKYGKENPWELNRPPVALLDSVAPTVVLNDSNREVETSTIMEQLKANTDLDITHQVYTREKEFLDLVTGTNDCFVISFDDIPQATFRKAVEMISREIKCISVEYPHMIAIDDHDYRKSLFDVTNAEKMCEDLRRILQLDIPSTNFTRRIEVACLKKHMMSFSSIVPLIDVPSEDVRDFICTATNVYVGAKRRLTLTMGTNSSLIIGLVELILQQKMMFLTKTPFENSLFVDITDVNGSQTALVQSFNDAVNSIESNIIKYLLKDINMEITYRDSLNGLTDNEITIPNRYYKECVIVPEKQSEPEHKFKLKKVKAVFGNRQPESEDDDEMIIENKHIKRFGTKRITSEKSHLLSLSGGWSNYDLGESNLFPKKVRDICEAIGQINKAVAEFRVDDTNTIIRTMSSRYDSLAILLYITAYTKKIINIIPADVYVMIKTYERTNGEFRLSSETQLNIVASSISRVRELFNAYDMSSLDTLGYLLFEVSNPLLILMSKVFTNEEFDEIIECATKEEE